VIRLVKQEEHHIPRVLFLLFGAARRPRVAPRSGSFFTL
jgi:hypothetical protein